MTRIRYSYNGAVYTSKNTFIALNDSLTVTIDAKGGKYWVEGSNGDTVAQGEGKDFHALKKLAKVALAGLGVNFSAEVRMTKKRKAALAEASNQEATSETTVVSDETGPAVPAEQSENTEAVAS